MMRRWLVLVGMAGSTLCAPLVPAAAVGPLPVPSLPAQTGACAQLTAQDFSSPACDAEMAADPEPPVEHLTVEQELFSYAGRPGATYMQITAEGPVTVYDAPDGEPLYQIDPGFNFVTPRAVRDDWVEINPGEWLPAAQLEPVEPSRFAGVRIEATPTRPFGWVLEDQYASQYPGGPPVYQADRFLPRYHLGYVYATVRIDDYDWYLLGPDRWIEQRRLGLVHPSRRPDRARGRWVAIDLYEQTLVAYDEDERMIFATLVASGIPGFSTPTGTFQVWQRRLNGPMTGAEGRPDYYRLENVPFAVYFARDVSLHGTYWHDGFGYRRSHGCINLSLADAHWLYHWLGAEGWVHVYYSRPY